MMGTGLVQLPDSGGELVRTRPLCFGLTVTSIEELAGLLDRHARPDLSTAIDGVRICKIDRTTAPSTSMSGTVVAMIAQGGKRLALGERMYEYTTGQYLVAPIDLPVTGHVMNASPDSPTLGFGMTLEPSTIAELLLNAGPGGVPRVSSATGPGIVVGDVTRELLDAIVRLVRLLDTPADRRALTPLVKREILWRLMTGPHGVVVRQLGLADSSLNHVTHAVQWIRDNYQQPFRVEDLAQLTGMSVSAFHRNFQAVTAMSPIQFQKHIRLHTARLMLVNQPHDVTGVGHRVGYTSVSQFSREYRRQFGAPPSLDALRLHRDGEAAAEGTVVAALP